MTVSSQTPINRSTGNGVTTVFPYTFKIISSADMEVSVNGVVKTLTVDYTLSGVGNDAGGNVTMLVAPATSASVVRRRNMALTRSTDYQDQGKLPASTLDSDLDSAVLMIQQVDEKTDRAMVLPTYVSGFSTELPTPIANYFLRVNSAGTALELASEITPGALTVTPFIETLLNDSMQADARTTLGAAESGANTDITSLAALSSINGGQLAGLRNRIINGGMQVAQRGALSITNGVANYGGCDRTVLYPGSFSTASGTVQKAVFPVGSSGFAQRLNVTTTGIGTIQAIQKIEAVNVQDLNSKTVTVSAILYQDTGAMLNAVISLYKTGTVDNWATPVLISTSSATSVPSASATAISKQFTLGASDATNGLFVQIQFPAVGAVTSKNFYIGDFQLEIGSVATPFEQRPYGMELALCGRYAQWVQVHTWGYATGAGEYEESNNPFRVEMRAVPSYGALDVDPSNTGGNANGNLNTQGFQSVSLHSITYRITPVGAGAYYSTGKRVFVTAEL